MFDYLTEAEREALGPAKEQAYATMFGTPVGNSGLNLTQVRHVGYSHLGAPTVGFAMPLVLVGALWVGDAISRLVYPGAPHGPEATADQVNIRHVVQKIMRADGYYHPFVHFHHLQSAAFSTLFLLFALATCGVGLLAWPLFAYHCYVAAVRSRAGEWHRLPIVGAWAERRVRTAAPTLTHRP